MTSQPEDKWPTFQNTLSRLNYTLQHMNLIYWLELHDFKYLQALGKLVLKMTKNSKIR
jgi:hypothetical protein